MIAGRLNNIIVVQKPTIVQNEFGANSIVWNNYLTTRAQVTYNNGNRVNENDEIVFAYEIIFTVRIYHQIDEQMQIIWNNKKYRILSIEPDKDKQKQIIRTALIND